jgi:putative tryptophan/tyrosine transport system substrate-binding protein
LVTPGALFNKLRPQIIDLASRYAVPAMYSLREYPEAGGLASYGPSVADEFRQAGAYSGRVLKGEKAADLPVLRSTKFEFVVNLKSARSFNIKVSDNLLSIADEVIE